MSPQDSERQAGTYHHGNLREALLDAVGEIIEDRGPGDVSLREAARRAGVSHGAPAHHFGDKLGMMTAFSVRGFELFRDRMQVASDAATTPVDKITAIGIEYLRFATEETAYFNVMFRSDMHDGASGDHANASYGAFAVVTSIADQLAGLDTGQGADPMLIALRAWTTVHGLATLWLDGALNKFWDGDDIYELALGIFATDVPNI